MMKTFLRRKDIGRCHYGVISPGMAQALNCFKTEDHVILFVLVYQMLALSFVRLMNALLVLSFPPVRFVMIWDCLSQQFLLGSLIPFVNVMPRNGKIAINVKAPTWITRFNKTISHGLLREGSLYSSRAFSIPRLSMLSFPN